MKTVAAATITSRDSQRDKWSSRIFVGYIVIGLLPLPFIDTEFNAEFVFALKYLTIPFIVVWYLLGGTLFRNMFKGLKTALRVFAPAVLGFVFALGSGGYVSVVNVVAGPQTSVTVRGRVIDRGVIGSAKSGDSYYLDIENTW